MEDSMFMDRKEHNIVKMLILFSLIYRINTISIRVLSCYFVDINKLILKFRWRGKRPRIANVILKEKNEVRRFKLPDFNTYYKATKIYKSRQRRLAHDRQIDQWNRVEPRNRLTQIQSTDLWQRSKGHATKKRVFSTDGAGTIGHPHPKG